MEMYCLNNRHTRKCGNTVVFLSISDQFRIDTDLTRCANRDLYLYSVVNVWYTHFFHF